MIMNLIWVGGERFDAARRKDEIVKERLRAGRQSGEGDQSCG